MNTEKPRRDAPPWLVQEALRAIDDATREAGCDWDLVFDARERFLVILAKFLMRGLWVPTEVREAFDFSSQVVCERWRADQRALEASPDRGAVARDLRARLIRA